MKLMSKNMLVILTVVLLVMAPVLFWLNFLCVEGFLSGMVYYGIILIGLAILRTGNAKFKDLSLNALIFLPVLYVFAIPIVMLSKSISIGGYEFFLDESLYQYIYLMSTALLILVFSSALYAKEKGLDTGKTRSNLLSILSIALYVRLYWLIVIETKNLPEMSEHMPHLKVEYIVLGGIPLFAAILILTLRKNLLGYVLGAAAGFPHMALVAYQFLTRFSRVAELGGATPQQGASFSINPVAVFFSSLVIFVFCLKGIMDNSPKPPESERGERGLRSGYIQAAVAVMLLQIAQSAKDSPELLTLSKDTGSPVGVITFVVGCLLVVAIVMAVLKIKWGLVFGIISGAWMLFHPVWVGVIEAQPGQSVAWWYLLLTMIPALLLIYFCALAWKKVFPREIN